MKTAEKRYNIEKKILYWKHRLQDLQDECNHSFIEMEEFKSQKKNFIWHICSDCGKVKLEKG